MRGAAGKRTPGIYGASAGPHKADGARHTGEFKNFFHILTAKITLDGL